MRVMTQFHVHNIWNTWLHNNTTDYPPNSYIKYINRCFGNESCFTQDCISLISVQRLHLQNSNSVVSGVFLNSYWFKKEGKIVHKYLKVLINNGVVLLHYWQISCIIEWTKSRLITSMAWIIPGFQSCCKYVFGCLKLRIQAIMSSSEWNIIWLLLPIF